jgi:hypothetical protein
MVGDLFEFAKGLTSILGFLQMRNFLSIDPQVAFAPWRNIDCKLIRADDRRELLDGSSLPDRQPLSADSAPALPNMKSSLA